MQGQNNESKVPPQHKKWSKQGLLEKGGRRPSFTEPSEPHARPKRQEQEPTTAGRQDAKP